MARVKPPDGCGSSLLMPPLTLASSPGHPAITWSAEHDNACAPTRGRHHLHGVTDASDPVPALKQQLARVLLDYLGASGQFNMASRIGVDQPRASNLQHGRLQRFSLQQLVRFVARAGGEVTLTVTWRSRRVWIIPRPTVSGADAGESHTSRTR